MALYRNHDMAFERLLSRASSERKIPVTMLLQATTDGFSLSAEGTTVSIQCIHQQAEKPQRENVVRQLSKLGGTPYECSGVELSEDFNYFIPSSVLAELRRQLVEKLMGLASPKNLPIPMTPMPPMSIIHSLSPTTPSYLLNIANRLSGDFYGVTELSAFELKGGQGPLMQCRHCLRYSLGYCVKHGGRSPQWHEPLYLRLGDGRRFRLEFNCKQCQMSVYAE
jgi:putative protease